MSDGPDIAALAAVAREVAAEWEVELGEPFALALHSFAAPAGDDGVPGGGADELPLGPVEVRQA